MDDGTKSKSVRKEEKRRIAELRQEKSKVTSGLRKELEELETKIETLEEEKSITDSNLADPSVYSNPGKARETKLRYNELEKELEMVYDKWTEISSKLEKIEEEYESQLSKNS